MDVKNFFDKWLIDLTFDQFESSTQEPTNEIGYVKFPNYIGQQWTQSGASSTTSATISCGYDGISNSSSIVLDQDRVVYCLLPLGNQAPFLIWDSPVDLEIFCPISCQSLLMLDFIRKNLYFL